MRLAPVTAMQLVKKYRPDSTIRWNGDWCIHSCIIDLFHPHHTHGDKNASAGISVRTGRYNCFTWSDHSISFRSLCKILHEDYDFEEDIRIGEDFKKAIDDKFTVKDDYKLDISIYSKHHHWYMTENRHMSDDVLDFADIRYDQYSGRIVIPIWEASTDGSRELVGIQKRRIQDPSIDGRHYQKYENDKGFRKADHVYGISCLDISRPLLVVESTMSVLKAWDYRLMNCCCILGSHASMKQLQFLQRFKTVVLCLDGDRSGVRGTRDLIRKLAGHEVLIADTVPYGSKDIADIGQSKTYKLIAGAMTPFEWMQMYDRLYI